MRPGSKARESHRHDVFYQPVSLQALVYMHVRVILVLALLEEPVICVGLDVK